jgi:hypothetical protein
MWKGGHDFGNQDYQETRQTLNGILRLSTTLTPMTFFIHGYFSIARGTLVPTLAGMKNRPEEPVANRMAEAKRYAVMHLLKFVFLTGSTGFLVKSAYNAFRTARIVNKGKNWLFERGERIWNEAYLLGSPELTPASYSRLTGKKRGKAIFYSH